MIQFDEHMFQMGWIKPPTGSRWFFVWNPVLGDHCHCLHCGGSAHLGRAGRSVPWYKPWTPWTVGWFTFLNHRIPIFRRNIMEKPSTWTMTLGVQNVHFQGVSIFVCQKVIGVFKGPVRCLCILKLMQAHSVSETSSNGSSLIQLSICPNSPPNGKTSRNVGGCFCWISNGSVGSMLEPCGTGCQGFCQVLPSLPSHSAAIQGWWGIGMACSPTIKGTLYI